MPRFCGGAVAVDQPAQIHHDGQVEVGNAVFGVPTIAPTTRAIHPGLRFEDVCVSVQRARFAYHDWMALVRDQGHTLGGFNQAWMASLGHGQIHVERALGLKIPPLAGYDAIDPLNPTSGGPKGDFRMPYEIRKYVYAEAPGVVDGECNAYWLTQ